MALLDSNLVTAIEAELLDDSSMGDYKKTVSVPFRALGIADGTDIDDEEKVQNAVNTIIAAKGWMAEINWLDCLVRFTK